MMLEFFIAALLVFFASLVSTMSGFGLATIMIPVLLLRYPLPETLLFVAIIHLMGDIWKLWLFRRGIKWKLILTFGALGIPATIAGATLVPRLPQEPLARALGVFILLYVVFLALKPSFKLRSGTSSTAIGGAVYGFFAGFFGISGEIRSAILSAYNLPKAVFLFTNGAIALLIDSTRIMTYIANGVELIAIPAWSLIALLPASLAGALLATRVVGSIPQKKFRAFIEVFLTIAACKLIFFP